MITITSPVESGKFSGTIEAPEYLTLPQVLEYTACKAAKDKPFEEQITVLWPLFQKFTGEWHIEGITKEAGIENMPFTPVHLAKKFAAWLSLYFARLIVGETSIPNA